MALVKFNENVDTYVKGDIMDVEDAELKRIDEYAERYEIKKPYSEVKAEKPAAKKAEEPAGDKPAKQ